MVQLAKSMTDNGAILVVDDESEPRLLVTDILRAEGYEVRTADSGQHALASVAAEPPDLILLNIQMPGMDGFEVCRRLKERAVSRNIPIIFISAFREEGERVEGFKAGAADFISKPFQLAEVQARVKTHLQLCLLRRNFAERVAERTEDQRVAHERLQADLAAHKRTEQALLESDERFRIVADIVPVMIAASGPDKRATFFNKRWLTFTGRKLEQELGKGWLEAVHPDDRQAFYAAYAASFDARRSCHVEFRLRRADGEYRWIICDGVPYAPGGVFAGYIGSAVDITDLKRAQEHAASAQKLESLGILAGGIAHDFNNLLGGILTNPELALSELAENVPGRDEIERIRAISIRAAEIVGALMTYAGQSDASFQPVNISGIVEELLALLKVSIAKQAALMTNLGRDLGPVWGDPAHIRQIVMNLVLNASEALKETGGVIGITTQRRNLTSGNYIQLEISDTGRGMPEATQGRIFDPFFTTKSAGRGLGLAVVAGIVRLHGGEINVVSAPGAGTRFQILLPCSDPAIPDPLIGSEAANEIPHQTGTILMVEDESTLRLVVSKALRKRGFTVIEASDGPSALDLFQKHGAVVGAILLDVTLPGMSGAEVLAKLRNTRPDLKVILTSAFTRPTIAESFGDQEFYAFIRKPYPIGELVHVLQNAMAK